LANTVRETIAVYYQNKMKHIYILCRRVQNFWRYRMWCI